MESILTSIKKMLGISEEYTHFDEDLIMHINSALAVLCQLGVGPSEGFFITNKSAVWSDFVPDLSKLQFIKTYVYQKVKLLFDPPQSSAAIQALNESIKEFEWRINVQVDPGTI
mgnify:FL=1